MKPTMLSDTNAFARKAFEGMNMEIVLVRKHQVTKRPKNQHKLQALIIARKDQTLVQK